MDEIQKNLSAEIAKLGATLPAEDLSNLCDALETLTPAQSIELVLGSVCQPGAKALCSDLLALWGTLSPQLPPGALALALRAAGAADEARRQTESIELVWTGPAPPGSSLRRTDQVLLEMIDQAQKTLTIVTFAHYKVPKIHQALLQAHARGVRVRLICESREASEGKYDLDMADMMEPELARAAEVYVWPKDKRPKAADGMTGVLHAKCAVRDGEALIISSANLTGTAMYSNMEMGVSLRNTTLATQVEKHLLSLIGVGILVRQ